MAEHQRRTVASWFELTAIDRSLPWVPVLQGQTLDDYLRHMEMYRDAGVDLAKLPLVGIGSVCKRQATDDVVNVCRGVAAAGVRLHGFGVKTLGVARLAPFIASSDSMAWSFEARQRSTPPLPGCRHGRLGTSKCNNCHKYALAWRARLLRRIGQ